MNRIFNNRPQEISLNILDKILFNLIKKHTPFSNIKFPGNVKIVKRN